MNKVVINVPVEFHEYPYGRTIEDHGAQSGESFLKEILHKKYEQAHKNNISLEIIYDGAIIGSSFIESSFGNLIKIHNASYEWLKKNLIITSELDPSLIDETFQYIQEAHKAVQKSK